jgi:hypothetical protein
MYRVVPSTRLTRMKRRCHAAWHLLRYRNMSTADRNALWIEWQYGVCPVCFDLVENETCVRCSRGVGRQD